MFIYIGFRKKSRGGPLFNGSLYQWRFVSKRYWYL